MALDPSHFLEEPAGPQASPGSADTRLRGSRLVVARGLCLSVLISALILFVAAIPARRDQLQTTFQDLSPAQELVLQELGVSITQHAGLVLAIEVISPLLFFIISLIIFWKRSDDWVVMLVSAGQVAYVVWASPPLDALVAAQGPLQFPATLIQVIGMISVMLFLYVFPDGHLAPGWTKPLMGLCLLWGLGWILLPGSVFDLSNLFGFSLPSFLLLQVWLATGLAAQLYHFSRVETAVQRQQTKMVLFASSIAILGYVVFGFNRFAFPVLAQPVFAGIVYDLVGVPIFMVITLVVPISLAFSILRYRLWDIDVFINQALVYGTLTAILAGLYTASVVLSQRLFVLFTGERSDAAIVLTTLIVASAFSHLRTVLQNAVDQRLKSVSDPSRSVKAFGDQMRSFIQMVDLEQLTARVLDEAVRAFDASGGAVYLLRNGHFQLAHVQGEWTQVEGMSVWLESEGMRYGWITLVPRRNGRNYTQEDRAVFEEISGLVSRTIGLLESAGINPLAGAVRGPEEARRADS